MAARNTMNIMIIVLLCVLVIALIFLLVLQNQAMEKAMKDQQDAETALQEQKAQNKDDLAEVMLLREKISGSSVTSLEKSILDAELKNAHSFLARNRSAPSAIENDNVPLNYNEIIANYQNVLTRINDNLKKAQQDVQRANSLQQQSSDDHVREIKAKTDMANLEKTEKEKWRRQAEALESSKAEIHDRFTRQVTEQEDQYTQLQIRYQRDIKLKDNQIVSLSNEIERMRLDIIPEKLKASAEPHGSILSVANQNTAFINMGRNLFVRPGLQFEVYETKGSKRHIKGRVEINRVSDTWSQVTILEEEKELNPIVAGDKIWCLFYDKIDKTPTFVIIGEKMQTPLMTRDFMIRKLKSSGAKVADDIGTDTDFVIALDGYLQDPKYDKARQHGVIILREQDVLDYIIP